MLELAQKALETALLAAQQPFPSGARCWELQPSPASSLAELPGVALESSTKRNEPREGSGLGGWFKFLLAQCFCRPCLQILAWPVSLSVLLRPSVPTPSAALSPNFRHHCIALCFSALGSSLVDHKLVTLCCEAR